MLAEVSVEEYSATLDRCAADALWEACIDAPPVDAFALAERLGMAVTSDNRLDARGRVVRWPGGVEHPDALRGAIALRPEPRRERRHWAVAHEVGETLAARVFSSVGLDPREAPPSSRERVANALAGRLLVPKRWLAALVRDNDADLCSLKATFSTASHELLARRLLDVVESPLVVTVRDHGATTWRRANFTGPVPAVSALERRCAGWAHERSEVAWVDRHDAQDDPASVWVLRARCWPVHEPLWRREVMFTDALVS
ncbi:MAG: ImmA/IrrE family metallo-endopeptidase [Lacipirellulaceae bacterium]